MTFADALVEVRVRVLLATLQSERSLFPSKIRNLRDHVTYRASLTINDGHSLGCASVFGENVDLCMYTLDR